MPKKKTNPGKYPVPQHVIDWYKKKHSKGRGRLPNWWPTPELTQDLCKEIAQGGTILELLKEPEFPPASTVFQWVAVGNNPDLQKDRHPDLGKFAGAWSRARQARLEHDIEEIEVIERRLLTQNLRVMAPEDELDNRGRRYAVLNEDALDPGAARIVLESRRWRLSRELPERFGDKSKVEHSGSVKVERPKDHMPEWMQAQIDDAAAKTPDSAQPLPKAQPKDGEPTVH